jgi:hypothetical protein
VGGLERRLELIETERRMGKVRLGREALTHLSDEELEALEESLLAEARARGEQPPPTNELLERLKQLEIETIERQRRHAEESRRRSLQLPGSDE